MRIPTYLDRYPAKMVSRLADRLIAKYCSDAKGVFDPFCGSGAVIRAAAARGISQLGGADINPISFLFAHVKAHGFDLTAATDRLNRLRGISSNSKELFPIGLPNKQYWFTDATLRKFEVLRAVMLEECDVECREDRALLLALSLSVRPCSRADQRSPKPFISKEARRSRRGKHFDPIIRMRHVLFGMHHAFGDAVAPKAFHFLRTDISEKIVSGLLPRFSHVVTSPPYINAQDYFRNFKLELYVLEGLLSFDVSDLREAFIGTERGDLVGPNAFMESAELRKSFPEIDQINKVSSRHSKIVLRYADKMTGALSNIANLTRKGGTFVCVGGDNLICGVRFNTVELLKYLAELAGFREFDRFHDPIRDRMLAPKRLGHLGLIKNETIIAFKRE